jgi:hypothetical protein
MSTISGIEFSIGLRHVLEDSLEIIRGRKLGDQRRELVLRKVGEFMNKAKNGSDAIGAAVFVDAEGAPETVEAYALLFHHLKRIFPDLVEKIKTTADVLQRLDHNEIVPPKGRKEAGLLIETLLDSLDYEAAANAYNPAETSQMM